MSSDVAGSLDLGPDRPIQNASTSETHENISSPESPLRSDAAKPCDVGGRVHESSQSGPRRCTPQSIDMRGEERHGSCTNGLSLVTDSHGHSLLPRRTLLQIGTALHPNRFAFLAFSQMQAHRVGMSCSRGRKRNHSVNRQNRQEARPGNPSRSSSATLASRRITLTLHLHWCHYLPRTAQMVSSSDHLPVIDLVKKSGEDISDGMTDTRDERRRLGFLQRLKVARRPQCSGMPEPAGCM